MGSAKPISGSFSPLNHRAVLTKGILCKFLLGKALKDCCRCWCCVLLFLFLLLFLLLLLLFDILHVIESFPHQFGAPCQMSKPVFTPLTPCPSQPKRKIRYLSIINSKNSQEHPASEERRDACVAECPKGSSCHPVLARFRESNVQTKCNLQTRPTHSNTVKDGVSKYSCRRTDKGGTSSIGLLPRSLRFLCHICWQQTLQADRILLVRFLILPSVTH